MKSGRWLRNLVYHWPGCAFSRSRISVSNISSLVGAAGVGAAASLASSLRLRLLMPYRKRMLHTLMERLALVGLCAVIVSIKINVG